MSRAKRQPRRGKTITVFVNAEDLGNVRWSVYYSPDMTPGDVRRICGLGARNYNVKRLDANETHEIERPVGSNEDGSAKMEKVSYPDKILVDGKYRKIFTSLDKILTQNLLTVIARAFNPRPEDVEETTRIHGRREPEPDGAPPSPGAA